MKTAKEPRARVINEAQETVLASDIKPHPRNPRRGKVEAISESIHANGFYGALVVNRRTKHILAGNHRFLAGKDLGMDRFPVIWVDVDRAEEERILAADNRTSDLGGYDNEALAALLEGLRGTDEGLVGTGYDDADLDALLEGLADEALDGEAQEDPGAKVDRAAELAAKWGTARGQVWQVGEHRLMCGDCREPQDVRLLFGEDLAQLAITSPPYASQRKYDPASGFVPIPADEYVGWFAPVQENVKKHLAHDGSWVVNIKEHAEGGQRSLYVMDLVLAHVRQWGWWFKDELVWRKTGVPGSWPDRLRNDWEPVFHFSKQKDILFFQDGNDKTSKDAFVFSGVKETSEASKNKNKTLKPERMLGMAHAGNVLDMPTRLQPNDVIHPAAFPPPLPAFFVNLTTQQGGNVYDPFMGSGTTAIACQQLGRRAFGMEISPDYLAVQLERLSEMGLTPRKIRG